MVTESERALIKEVMSEFSEVEDLYVSGKEEPYCVISFGATFSKDSAYDLELTKEEEGFIAVLLTSSETPLMQDHIESINGEQIDSLFDHVIETIRELEGN